MAKLIDDLKHDEAGVLGGQTRPNQISTSAGSDRNHLNLQQEIASFVHSWRLDRGSSCPLPDLFRFVKKRVPEMQVGGFQDLMRTLHDNNVIRLAGWSGSLDRIPEPEFALFVSNKVMYYAVSSS